MNLTIDRKALHAALQSTVRAISSRSSLPILANVDMETNGDSHLILRATDLELYIECEAPAAAIRAPGSVTLPAKTLSEIIGSLPDGEVALAVEGCAGTISCGRSRYRIQGLPANEYPPTPQLTDAFRLDVPAAVLATLLRRTLPCTSPDDTRPILTGVLLSLAPAGITCAATDTHRLGVATATLAHSGTEQQAVIPARALREVLRLLKDGGGDIAVDLGANEVRFTADGTTLTSRLIEGKFPAYERVIPKAEPTLAVTLETAPLTQAVKRAAIVARDNANRVMLLFLGDELSVTAQAGDTGHCREELTVAAKQGDTDLSICFNSQYFLDALDACGGDSVVLEMTEALAPAIMRPLGGDGYRCILMPMAQG